MKKIKVLFIAYHFLPKMTAGTFRTVRYLNNLNCFDIDAVVLTTDDSKTDSKKSIVSDNYNGFPVYRVKEWNIKPLWYYPAGFMCMHRKLFRKTYDLYGKSFNFVFIDYEWGWILPTYFKAIEIIKKHKIDMIYVSSPPNSSSYLGYRLKKATNKKFILDLRDRWNMTDNNLENNIINKYSKLECKILKKSDAIILTSGIDKKNYCKVTNPEKVHLIYNGYDELHVTQSRDAKRDNTFKLVYCGSWRLPYRSPQNVLMALRECTFPWKFISVGSGNEILLKLVDKLHLKEHVEIIPSQPKEQMIKYMNDATAFFLIQGEFGMGQPNPAIAAKTMDYLMTGKPIFAQLPEGDNKDFLKRYGKQVNIVDHHDYSKLRDALIKLHRNTDLNRQVVSENKEFLEKFSGKALTQQLINVIRLVYEANTIRS